MYIPFSRSIDFKEGLPSRRFKITPIEKYDSIFGYLPISLPVFRDGDTYWRELRLFSIRIAAWSIKRWNLP